MTNLRAVDELAIKARAQEERRLAAEAKTIADAKAREEELRLYQKKWQELSAEFPGICSRYNSRLILANVELQLELKSSEDTQAFGDAKITVSRKSQSINSQHINFRFNNIGRVIVSWRLPGVSVRAPDNLEVIETNVSDIEEILSHFLEIAFDAH